MMLALLVRATGTTPRGEVHLAALQNDVLHVLGTQCTLLLEAGVLRVDGDAHTLPIVTEHYNGYGEPWLHPTMSHK